MLYTLSTQFTADFWRFLANTDVKKTSLFSHGINLL